MTRKLAVALTILCGVLMVGCTKDAPTPVAVEPEFRADGVLQFSKADGSAIISIAIEIAETDQAQEIGLMNRRSLPARGGMLFINQESKPRQFWMKSTPLPLDIIFVASDSTVVNIAKRTVPLSDSLIKSTGDAQYIVEVRAGFTDKYGIDETSRIWWERREVESEP